MKKTVALLLTIVMLFSATVCFAKEIPTETTTYWQSLSAKEATALLNMVRDGIDASFIFVYYSDTCYYSQTNVPKFQAYAKENNIKIYGLNRNDYPNWSDWAAFAQGTITYPLVIVYNGQDKQAYTAHSVHSKEAFQYMLTQAGYSVSTKETEKIKTEPQAEKKQETKTEADGFSDVPNKSVYAEAVNYLSGKGILTGYEDGTFKPDNPVNRAEAAAMIVRAKNIRTDNNVRSIYSDVANDFWGKTYIMAATEAGILNGTGSGKFSPTDEVTHNQLAKITVCMAGLQADAQAKGDWPKGYVAVAKEVGIADSTLKPILTAEGDRAATRGEVALYLYNTLTRKTEDGLMIGGSSYVTGMDASALPVPDEMLPSVYGFTWYVFDTDSYKNFFAAGVADGKVQALAATGTSFSYFGYRAGDSIEGNTEETKNLYTDKNDDNIIHGVMFFADGVKKQRVVTDETLYGESKMNFHFTNGFRLYHGKTVLLWDEDAAEVARMHSQDMADNNYFAHNSQDGRKFSARLQAGGIQWMGCAENISAGRESGFLNYNGWVNSEGHRKNMLSQNVYLGVGGGYNPNSTYAFYFTQDFYR